MSYFTAGHPEPGSAQFSFPFDDTNYWFASEEHRRMFAADPERYAPQFKGYCALSVARGLRVEADPEAWTISNGKLYVFGTKDSLLEFKANPASCKAATIFERCPSSRSCVAKSFAVKDGSMRLRISASFAASALRPAVA